VFLKLKPARKAECKLSTTYFKCNRDLGNILYLFFSDSGISSCQTYERGREGVGPGILLRGRPFVGEGVETRVREASLSGEGKRRQRSRADRDTCQPDRVGQRSSDKETSLEGNSYSPAGKGSGDLTEPGKKRTIASQQPVRDKAVIGTEPEWVRFRKNIKFTFYFSGCRLEPESRQTASAPKSSTISAAGERMLRPFGAFSNVRTCLSRVVS
jgi:hypothetical protein